MWNKLRARHYLVLILLAIVALETSAIAIDKLVNTETETAFALEGSFQNNSFLNSFETASACPANKTLNTEINKEINEEANKAESKEAKENEKNALGAAAEAKTENITHTVSADFAAASLTADNAVKYVDYSVKKGDSLSEIAVKFGTNTSELKLANKIENQHEIKAGQTLKVPAALSGLVYTVKKGDSLSKIASKFAVSLRELIEENNLKSHILMAEQKIKIPFKKSTNELAMVKEEPQNAGSKLEKVSVGLKQAPSAPKIKLIKTEGSRLQIAREMAEASKPSASVIEKALMTTPPVIVRNALSQKTNEKNALNSQKIALAKALDGKKDTNKAGAKESAKESAKVSAKESAKVSTKESAKVSTKESAKESAKASTKQSTKETVKESQRFNYTVAKGDSLLKIAHKYNTTAAQIQLDNSLNDTSLKAGQTLVLQPGKKLYRIVKTVKKDVDKFEIVKHKVKRGESLSVIAQRYSTTIKAIIAANNMQNTVVMAGDTLKVPTPKTRASRLAKNKKSGSFLQFKTPVRGRVSDNYGWRIHPIHKKRKFHAGVDIAARRGTPIIAAASGKVVFSGTQRGYGKIVIISHANGYSTRYGHCSSLLVKQGQTVKSGQLIAKVGATGVATGNHLHFEIRKNGKTLNPQNFIKL